MNEQITTAWQGLRRWANDNTAHAIPLFFCLLSLQNIQEFFYLLHPNIYISWAAGLALGFGLLRQAVKLSDMEWNMHDRKYTTVLATTIAFALVSGGIQAAAYSQYMHWVFAVPVGIALPTVGEVGVALSIAAHRQAVRARRVAHMQDELGDEMRLAMFDAIRTMNRSKLQDEVEAGAIAFARALIANTNQAMIADLANGPTVQVVAQSQIAIPVAMLAETQPQAATPDDKTQPDAIIEEFQTQLDEYDLRIVDAIRNGAYTQTAIAKATGIAATTLKRRVDDKLVGRLPKLCAANVIHNSSGADGSEYRLI
jgi:uncharacterized membrane protein